MAEDLRWLDATELAKHIRAALKAAFPGVKFSVTSDKYSMGSSVYVKWTDGPASKAVDRLLDQFRGKSFNGLDDSTHYHPIVVNGERCKAGSYLSTSRELSDAVKARIKARVASRTGDEMDYWDGYWPTVGRTHVIGSTLVIEKHEHERETALERLGRAANVLPFAK